jgi:hypothetical protein
MVHPKKILFSIFAPMLKRNFNIFMLCLAGIFLLGHNFIPHPNHEDHTEVSHSTPDKHHNTDTDDTALSSLFSQSQHQNINKEIQNHINTSDSYQLRFDTFFISAGSYAIQAISPISKIVDPPKKIVGHVFYPHLSLISFRGPPASV